MSVGREVKVGVGAAALSLFAPLIFVAVLARRAGWRRAVAVYGTWRRRASTELDHWRFEYTLHEFLTGEMKRDARR